MVAADASAQFGKLIDEWIAAYPIERCSLTLADLRLVAGAILLMETSGSVPRLASSARVVAIMFVLFVREGVEVATPPHEPEILGVGMWKSFGMLHKIIVKAELSHSDFVEAVVENDLHGESIELAQSSDIISALFAQSICSEGVQRRTPLRLNLRAFWRICRPHGCLSARTRCWWSGLPSLSRRGSSRRHQARHPERGCMLLRPGSF